MVDREQWPTRRAFLGADSCVEALCRGIRCIRALGALGHRYISELRY